MIEEIKNIEEKFSLFTENLGIIKGEFKTLKNQQEKSEILIEKLKKDEVIYAQAVELLTLVQGVTRDKIKNSFEMIVSHALRHIYKSDEHSFRLEFSRRGNLHELNFYVVTPDKPEPLSLLKCEAGGTKNIISNALRIVLMEISSPKISGFIINDESFANLSSEYQPNASEFLNEISQKFNRQIIMITHSKEFIENNNYNKIEIK